MSVKIVTEKTFFERFYLVLGLKKWCLESTIRIHPRPRPFTIQLFLDFRSLFLVTIHQMNSQEWTNRMGK